MKWRTGLAVSLRLDCLQLGKAPAAATAAWRAASTTWRHFRLHGIVV